ncbi:C40 family peptidase [Pontibacter sp. MBLB2868]|uniref:C40 family peptidase n=1 Tax=Pontibacter sp. MBLB2868 TaxID=3451555 RepID=UPI003F74B951
MTKAIVLSALAILSLTLSYFYEVTPAKSSAPAHASTTFKITPYAINSGEDMVRAMEFYEPVEEATAAAEEFYSQKLNMRFTKPKSWQLAQTVTRWIGTPYRYGRSSRKGTDCSGFVSSIYREVYGIRLSRSSKSMFRDVQHIKKDEMQTGDLVFFRRGPKQPIFHVGIYLKNNKFIHSATNGGVMVSSLNEPYYRNYFYAGGRVN